MLCNNGVSCLLPFYIFVNYEAVLPALKQQSLLLPNIEDNRLVSENSYASQKHRQLPVTWIRNDTIWHSQNTNPHTQTYEFKLVNMIFSNWEF